MKTLAQINDVKLATTTKASDISRQLAFAGFAVLWLVRDASSTAVTSALSKPALLFGLTLALDIFQYAIASLIWVVFYNHQYDVHKADESKLVDIPSVLNYPAYICFWAKVSAVLFGWALLADHLNSQWKVFHQSGN